jgi:hypothetical protein
MKQPSLRIQKILIATLAGLSFASLLTGQPSLADTNQPFSGLDNGTNSNPLSGNSSDFNLFNLIHQANFGIPNWDSNQQNQQLHDAAADFKDRQKKLIQGQQQQNPNLPTSGQNTSASIILPSDK